MANRLLDRHWPWLVAALLIVLWFLSTFVEIRVGDPGDPRPLGSADDIEALAKRDDLNVLFILIDTLRADHIGSYGYERDTSPTLDRLAASGVRLNRHLAQSSWTKASMASLWTGMYPARTGVTRFDDVIPDAAEMPAERLKNAGFRTVGIFRNGWVAPTFGFEQGFDTYTRPAPRPLSPRVRIENPTLKNRGTDEDATSAALEFLRIHGRERWFLYLHLMDVHEYTYSEDSALFGGAYADVYDNAIRWTDGVLDVFFQHLAHRGLLDKTLVVITSDHGEAFRERGIEGHARRVFRETTEVPLVVSFPFRLEPGVVVEARTRNVDVWPTIYELIGMEAPTPIDGRSRLSDIVAAARGQAAPDPEPLGIAHLDMTWGQGSMAPHATVAVSEGSLRFVRVPPEGERLYDASIDPAELDDQSEEQPEAKARLSRIADEYLETVPPWGEAPKREIDELELNQLRALGYALP